MEYFVMSDIHIDFFLNLWKDNKEWGYIATAKKLGNEKTSKIYENCVPSFQKYYDLYMAPAENLIFAGDCANDYYSQINFYKFLGTIYDNTYIVYGNHDLGITSTFGNGNPFKYSEDKCNAIKEMFKNDEHVHILDGDVLNDIGGTMGMCDFHYTTNYDLGIPFKIKEWQKKWYDGRVWHIKTPEWHSGYKINPIAILESEKSKLDKIIEQQPKIIMTHFCPIELGTQREYENASSTAFFYFEAKSFLDKLDHETWWFCGHIHAFGQCDYVNANGHTIHIYARPQGYPGENPYVEGAFETIYDETSHKYCGRSNVYTLNNRKFKL